MEEFIILSKLNNQYIISRFQSSNDSLKSYIGRITTVLSNIFYCSQRWNYSSRFIHV